MPSTYRDEVESLRERITVLERAIATRHCEGCARASLSRRRWWWAIAVVLLALPFCAVIVALAALLSPSTIR
jgi:hypothetical protein